MATIKDVSAVVESALTEIGVNGHLDVSMDDRQTKTWVGEPTGDDYEVVVTVKPLDAASADQPSV